VIVLHAQKVAGISGSEAHLLQLLPDLRKRGWDIRFLMLHEGEPGAWDFARELRAGGVPVDAIEMTTDVDPRTFARVLVYLAKHRPTILHTHLVHADAYGLTAGMIAGVPIRLSTKHGFNEFREGRLFALGDRTIGALAHRQIAISRGLARYLSKTEGFPEPEFEIVHYGIAAGPAPEPYAGVGPRFLCIGRLIPIKGHVVLLRAFRAVLDRRPEARLEIAGRGVLEHGLRDLTRQLGLEHAVSFLGHVTPVQRSVDRAFAVVVPSLGEGFGMVALEAMERGRPVIAASIGGLDGAARAARRRRRARRGDARARRRPRAGGRDGRCGARPGDRALPRGSLHRAHRGGLPLLARAPPERCPGGRPRPPRRTRRGHGPPRAAPLAQLPAPAACGASM
jgi:glycosyltransferase involved in cell wall biosynthesis